MLDGLEIEVGADGYKYERFRFEGYKYMNQFLFKRIFSYGVGQRGYLGQVNICNRVYFSCVL